MVAVAPADSTVAKIISIIRELTASPSESSLSSAYIQELLNTFYTQDFPYAIKIDQLKSIYTIFTSPNVDRYPLDVNGYQGIRDPVYFEGVRGWFYKDRDQFFNVWPRWPVQFTPINGDGTTAIFNFNLGGTPFLPTMVVLGGTAVGGNIIRIVDDGGLIAPGGNALTTGNLLLLNSDEVGNFNPAIPPISPLQNTLPSQKIGTVNYVTGACSITFPAGSIPAAGTQITAWVSQYSASRPFAILFWNNYFQVRPVPDGVYKIELETYMTPAQFLDTTNNPIVKQWAQYLAYGVAMEILRRRQDLEGVENLREGFMRQEGLVLERQAIEEIGQRNATIFSASTPQQSFGLPQGWWY